MVEIREKDGVFSLDGQEFDVKIDNNRRIYVRKKGKKSFEGVGEITIGYTYEEKKKFLYNFYNALMERKSEII